MTRAARGAAAGCRRKQIDSVPIDEISDSWVRQYRQRVRRHPPQYRFQGVGRPRKGVQYCFKTDRYGDVAEVRHKGRTLVLLKPSTYMNLSGKAVSYWMQREKIEAENVFVVVDDIAIPFGTIRIRTKGERRGT